MTSRSILIIGSGHLAYRTRTASKLVGIALILASTCFIWMIFSLTVDGIITRRVQLALGRKKYSRREHVILYGLGRLRYFIAEGLLAKGEQLCRSHRPSKR